MPEGTIERPLSPLLPRDCGHECRVCKVMVVSLTDYAGHISSPTHKQNVEAAEKNTRNNQDEDYFDQALVDLIEKRKEQMRKEKEAAAAKLAKEKEERRKKEEFQQRLKDAKERFQMERGWQPSSQAFNRTSQHNSWYRGNQHCAKTVDTRPWHSGKKSATWHASAPPNFQRWASGDLHARSFHTQECWGNKQWDQGAFYGSPQGRLPWLSNGGSSNGIYGRNNISQFPQRNWPLSHLGTPQMYPPPPHLNINPVKPSQNTGNEGSGPHTREKLNNECDHNSSKSSKTFGSNPKLEKSCRWSPYPVTKGFDSVPHKDTSSNSSVPQTQRQEKASEASALSRPSRSEQKTGQFTSSGKTVEERGKLKKNPKPNPRDRSSSGSRSSSAQKDGYEISSSSSSSQKSSKPLLPEGKKLSSLPALNIGTQHSKASSQVHQQPKSSTKKSGIKAPAAPLLSKQGQKLPDTFKKDVQSEKRGSLDSCSSSRLVEEQLDNHAQSQTGVNKENTCRQNSAQPVLPESNKEGKEKLALPFSNCQFLQSLHVSTSTVESSEPAASSRERQEITKSLDKETYPVAPDEALSAVEGRPGSESDASRSDEAQTASASCLSKLDLPSALKRDLTKHIGSKNKSGGHEPNLNIARRVRNLSESRRSDSEKDSGLKPTVRQLISSSGSRRTVNWDQVYQEVRKKQEKGKGMPRFGIEMVPYEQEDQSQEEDDIPLLEGFHWDSLVDIPASAGSRKRSLSESSVAPAAALFPSHVSKETEQRDGLRLDQRRSSISPKSIFAKDKDDHCEKEVEQMLGLCVAQLQEQPAKVMSETAQTVQCPDSVLGDSSSGAEQLDGQGTGKRRRAARDVLSPEASGLEHDNKRRKVKSKREHSHIDQLLAVSLREEELSRSLQTVDASLIQARAALQAAYMEVQRFMVVKQQITTEMSSLRSKRIELLKGMQAGSLEVAPQVQLKEEKMDPVEAEPHVPDVPAASSPSPSPAVQRPSPPSSSISFMSLAIKEEPQSPVQVSSDPVVENTTLAPVEASPPETSLDFQLSPDRQPESYQAHREPESSRESVDCKESLSVLVETTEKAIQATRSFLAPSPDSKLSTKLLLASRRGSEVGSPADCSGAQSFEPPSATSVLNMPASPSELRSGKRVRKLKKRKVLKKAQGTEPPESSDTELDAEASKPRWLRPRRRPSSGSVVSTSSLSRDGDVNMEESKDPPGVVFTAIRPEAEPHKQTGGLAEDPVELVGILDSEESMEVSALVQVPDSSGLEPQSLACYEVTSTSDMEVCKSSESEAAPPGLTKAPPGSSSGHFEDDIPTEGAFEGHQEAVNAMQIHNELLYTCSGDRTVKAFDLVSRRCVAVFEGHSSKVSCLLVSAAPCLHHRLYSGSSDQTIRCYSLKTQELEQQFCLSDRVLCLHSRWKSLYAGLANGTVVTFNLKTNKQTDVFECHGPRAVSCLASSQEGSRRILLVGSFDSTISVRDAKNGLLLRTLEGHTKTVLCMKVVNDLVFSGSSDQCVYAHNIHTGELLRVYKGHSHAVTVVTVLGKVMVTACLDKLVRVYDLQTREQLQVYGGHQDMVTCMTTHKNMIYTGCYDGSVQAIKLNLMQNYRCWWLGCPMVLGVMEHLQQHLINDHTGSNFQTLRCRWKDCEESFCTRSSNKQGMLLHMQKHAEEEADLEP